MLLLPYLLIYFVIIMISTIEYYFNRPVQKVKSRSLPKKKKTETIRSDLKGMFQPFKKLGMPHINNPQWQRIVI